jgi:glycosyltransferase involved in cell wall biosynthesis
MRVLHLIDPQSPDGGPCTLRLLAEVMRRLDARHDAVVIGGRSDVELAVRCGVEVAGSMCPPRALPWAGASALREAARAVERQRGSHDLVHAWTARSGALASVALVNHPGLTSLHAGPREGLAWWHTLRTLRHGRQTMLAASMAIRRQYRSVGFGNDRVALLPPGVTAAAAVSDREALRALLAGRSDTVIESGTFVVGLFGEPAESADANVAATIAARLALSGRRIKLLVHPRATHRIAAETMMRHLHFDDVIFCDELVARAWMIGPALDAVLFIESQAGRRRAASVLPLLNALACGIPVVAEESDSLRDVLEDGAGCMVVKPGEVNAAAQRLMRLCDDRGLGQRLCEQAKTLAADMFDIDAYTVRLRHSYDLLLANRSVRTTTDPLAMGDVSAEVAVA